MKQNKGFTLIELLAVIVILAVIALIATPLIMGTITNAKKNAFKDTAYGILKAGEKYTAETLLASENTYLGETITLPETGTKKLNYKGQEPEGGEMNITKNGDISLVIHNSSWCAIKNSDDKEVIVEKYDKDTCKIDVLLRLSKIITNKNKTGNSDGLFKDDYGNIRYRGSNGEVKNYVSFNHEIWRIIGVFEGKVKLIRNESLGNMKWNEIENNNWDTSTINTYLNGEFYNGLSILSKSQIDTVTYYLGGNSTADEMYSNTMYKKERGSDVYPGNPTSTNQVIGLMYPSDYGYAARSSCNKNLYNYEEDENCGTEGNWLFTGVFQWFMNPRSDVDSNVFLLSTGSFVADGGIVTTPYGVRPVVYLKSSIYKTGGDGTSSNPYTIE